MADTATWDILDRRAIDDLVGEKGRERVLGGLMSDDPTPEDRARLMAQLAIDGNILQLRNETASFQRWAEKYGFKRLQNTLVELDRVLSLSERGQAILQAQALTRHIARTLGDDIQAFKRAVAAD